MRPHTRVVALAFASAVVSSAFAQEGNFVSLGNAAEHAVQESKLTLPGSKPFHLVADIVEKTNPESDYRARVEEFWINPEKWRRTIESPEFSQVLITNGNKVFEKDTGEYFPWWLNDLVKAMMDPLPMADMLEKTNARLPKPQGGAAASSCARLNTKIDRWRFCFEGSQGLLSFVLARGFEAEYKEYKGFAGKQVARLLIIDPEPGTTIQAKVKTLEEFLSPDDPLFAVDEVTPPQNRIRSIQVDQDTVRKTATASTEIAWPTVGEGPTKGGCGVYISADRNGIVREVWPKGCDNAGLEDPLREMVKKWRLKPAKEGGTPVQIESLVTFPFDTQADNSKALPVLTDAEARGLASDIVEPLFPPGSAKKGTQITVQISVDETGKLTGIKNTANLSTAAFLAANAALRRWHFKPYVKDGKAQYFHADIIFRP